MNPQDWYLNLLLRLDRIQSMVYAINRFYESKTDDEAQQILTTITRLQALPCPVSFHPKP